MANNKKGTWEVRIRATADKVLCCENCTEEQAHANPYAHVVEETEVDQSDYEVLDVKPCE